MVAHDQQAKHNHHPFDEAAEQVAKVAPVAPLRHAGDGPLCGPGAAKKEQEHEERQPQIWQDPKEALEASFMRYPVRWQAWDRVLWPFRESVAPTRSAFVGDKEVGSY